jgi:hypothetical protein
MTYPTIKHLDTLEMLTVAKRRIKNALDKAFKYGPIDGAHHKDYCIDQMVRVLTGCPVEIAKARDVNGLEYEYTRLGESDEYKKWVKEHNAGEDGPDTYQWSIGTIP